MSVTPEFEGDLKAAGDAIPVETEEFYSSLCAMLQFTRGTEGKKYDSASDELIDLEPLLTERMNWVEAIGFDPDPRTTRVIENRIDELCPQRDAEEDYDYVDPRGEETETQITVPENPVKLEDSSELVLSRDEVGFRLHINEVPLDQLVYLAYADWLEDRGEVQRAQRLRAFAKVVPELAEWWQKENRTPQQLYEDALAERAKKKALRIAHFETIKATIQEFPEANNRAISEKVKEKTGRKARSRLIEPARKSLNDR